jgi:hypothetical protein
MPTSFLSSFDEGAQRQRGFTFCPLNLATAKKVRLSIWGNTERQDAPYDIAEVKLVKLETTPCPRDFIVKKCEGDATQNNLWVDCPTAALGSSYQQCCSPLLAINSTIGAEQYKDRGDWQFGMVPDSQNFSTLMLGCAYNIGPLETYAIHPNLTPECLRADVAGLGDTAEDILGTCDVEIPRFRRCPESERPAAYPGFDWVTRTEPLVEFYRKGDIKQHPDQSTYPDHQYRVCSKTLVWEIFYPDNVLEFSSPDGFPAQAVPGRFYAAGGQVYTQKPVDYAPQGQYPFEQEYVLIGPYSPDVVQWYAAVVVICIPSAGSAAPTDGSGPPGFSFYPIPGVGDALLYYAPLECGTNGKPIGAIPGPPPAEWGNCEIYGDVDVSADFVFPTMTLYRPGTGVPTGDSGKPPTIDLPPEWCGVQQCKAENCDCDNPKPFAALGVECGCNKNCLVNNVIARVGIAGSDENIQCDTSNHFMCRTFVVPAGDYYVALSTDTVDQLHHTNMQHHFLVEWCDTDDDTLTCTDSCSSVSSSSSSSSGISSSSSNSDQTAQNLFDATSWAAVAEPYKSYLNVADARWSSKLQINAQKYAAIVDFYSANTVWAGIALNSITYFNNPESNTIATCSLAEVVNIGTGGPDTYIPTYFDLTINEAFVESATFWETVIAHELGHALGIGSLWSAANFALNGSVYTNTQTAYNGITTLTRYYTPLENTGGSGTASGHWENSYRPAAPGETDPNLAVSFYGVQNELMVGAILQNPGSMVLSRLTLQALVDIGFELIGTPEADPTPVTGAQLLTAGGTVGFCGHTSHTPNIITLPGFGIASSSSST